MSRKPRFKLQRRNSGDEADRRKYGNKQWLNIHAQPSNKKGWLLTFEQATEQYHQVNDWFINETYRIVEKR